MYACICLLLTVMYAAKAVLSIVALIALWTCSQSHDYALGDTASHDSQQKLVCVCT